MNGVVATFDSNMRIIKNGAVLVSGSVIEDVGKEDAMRRRYSHEEIIDAEHGLIMPGMICSHTHLYSSMARGMPMKGKPPKKFIQILEDIWWKLDSNLNREDIFLSAMLGIINAIKHGTTCIIDHHASTSFIRDSLSTIADAVIKSGIRASLCYEVTDRNGEERAIEGIKENSEFAKETTHERISPLMGLHASFTISSETLGKAKEEADKRNIGFHLHVAEDLHDVNDSLKKYGKRVVERLHHEGILHERTLAAHCIHVDDKEIKILADTKTKVIHCPESNMNNAVGVAPVPKMLERGICVGVGTDGITSDMFKEIKVAYLLHKISQMDPTVMSADDVIKMQFKNNSEIGKAIFSKKIGVIEKGALADIIILNYRNPTPMHAKNFASHIIFGIGSEDVSMSIVNGDVIFEDGKILTIDENKIYDETVKKSEKLWERML